MSRRKIPADFDGVDDLLSAAQRGRLGEIGPISLQPSGRLGPLAEFLLAVEASANELSIVNVDVPFATDLRAAIREGGISGSRYGARAGAFSLSADNASLESPEWHHWCLRAEQAAIRIGLPKPLAAAIIGAMVELRENIDVHSGRPRSGLVAYGATSTHFEIVVADAGMGVLASLRQSPEFCDIVDSGDALRVAISDGNSRFGMSSGHGYGMGQMFRALANHDGELRFRSLDHALTVRGHSPSLTGTVELRQKTPLAGLVITVRCPTAAGFSPNGGPLIRHP